VVPFAVLVQARLCPTGFAAWVFVYLIPATSPPVHEVRPASPPGTDQILVRNADLPRKTASHLCRLESASGLYKTRARSLGSQEHSKRLSSDPSNASSNSTLTATPFAPNCKIRHSSVRYGIGTRELRWRQQERVPPRASSSSTFPGPATVGGVGERSALHHNRAHLLNAAGTLPRAAISRSIDAVATSPLTGPGSAPSRHKTGRTTRAAGGRILLRYDQDHIGRKSRRSPPGLGHGPPFPSLPRRRTR
jgi:hypothetical protein